MTPDSDTAKRLAEVHCAAWTSLKANEVASRYAEPTSFAMNGGDAMTTRAEIAEMAQGFMADFPDLILTCETVLVADHHMVYAWIFRGHYAETGKLVEFSGWEEWDLGDDLKVIKSLGWYDVEDYNQQLSG